MNYNALDEERERRIKRKANEAWYLLEDAETAIEEIQECYSDNEDEWWNLDTLLDWCRKTKNKVGSYT